MQTSEPEKMKHDAAAGQQSVVAVGGAGAKEQVGDQGVTKVAEHPNEAWTVTWGDVAMNEVHMQRIGQAAEQGVSVERLREIKEELGARDMLCYLIDLRELLPEGERESAPEAAVLVVKSGVGPLTEDPHGEAKLLAEQRSMPIDKQAWDPRHGGVFDKHNRYNNLLSDADQAVDYANKQGTVIDCSNYPITSKLRAAFTSLLSAFLPLVGESNRYFDASACGIGWHVDRERKMVAGVRLGPGATGMPLKFLWFCDSKPVGAEGRLLLDAGDVYFMSEKAVGFDWLTKKQLTLRHSAGADKYSSVGTLKAVREGTVRPPPVVQLFPAPTLDPLVESDAAAAAAPSVAAAPTEPRLAVGDSVRGMRADGARFKVAATTDATGEAGNIEAIENSGTGKLAANANAGAALDLQTEEEISILQARAQFVVAFRMTSSM